METLAWSTYAMTTSSYQITTVPDSQIRDPFQVSGRQKIRQLPPPLEMG